MGEQVVGFVVLGGGDVVGGAKVDFFGDVAADWPTLAVGLVEEGGVAEIRGDDQGVLWSDLVDPLPCCHDGGVVDVKEVAEVEPAKS